MHEQSIQTLADIGEHEAIRRLCDGLTGNAATIVGPGDDCAVVRPSPDSPFDLVMTSDPVIEGAHFTADASPRAVGHKAIARNLSDIAAMGGEPLWALVNIAAPASTPVERLEKIYAGANETAARHSLAIVGGDMATAPTLALHVFVCGRVPRGRARLRSSARPGDSLFVTGTLGGSIHGRHLNFEPRIEQGIWLRDRAAAMIDVSDGIATDARHLARRSDVSITIHADALPVSDAAKAHSGLRDASLRAALCDGEDFELLFTIRGKQAASLKSQWQREFPQLPLSCIGSVCRGSGELLLADLTGHTSPLTETGFGHFQGENE